MNAMISHRYPLIRHIHRRAKSDDPVLIGTYRILFILTLNITNYLNDILLINAFLLKVHELIELNIFEFFLFFFVLL